MTFANILFWGIMTAISLCIIGAVYVSLERIIFRRYLHKRDLNVDNSSSERWIQKDHEGEKDEEMQQVPGHEPFEKR